MIWLPEEDIGGSWGKISISSVFNRKMRVHYFQKMKHLFYVHSGSYKPKASLGQFKSSRLHKTGGLYLLKNCPKLISRCMSMCKLKRKKVKKQSKDKSGVSIVARQRVDLPACNDPTACSLTQMPIKTFSYEFLLKNLAKISLVLYETKGKVKEKTFRHVSCLLDIKR